MNNVTISLCFVTFCKQRQRNWQRIIKHAYTGSFEKVFSDKDYKPWLAGDIKLIEKRRGRSSRCCGLASSHGLVLYIGLISWHLPPWTEWSKKNDWPWLLLCRFGCPRITRVTSVEELVHNSCCHLTRPRARAHWKHGEFALKLSSVSWKMV